MSGITANTNFPINKETLYVNGRFLCGRHGNTVILRGVDLPLLDDWSFPGSDYLSELAQSGANAVRIQWYINYGDSSRPAYSITDLGNFLDRCVAASIIPIVMLADETCQSDPNLVNTQFVPLVDLRRSPGCVEAAAGLPDPEPCERVGLLQVG